MTRASGIVSLLALCMCLVASHGRCDVPAERPFRMGFTPFPYAFTLAAVEDTRAKVLQHGDLVAVHLDNGVPWSEAWSESPFPENLESEIAAASALRTGRGLYLGVAPLAMNRREIAAGWQGAPITGELAGLDFADPRAAAAYARYLQRLADRLQPDWFNFGVEATALRETESGRSQWPDFLAFLQSTHDALRLSHPRVRLTVSVVLTRPDSDRMADLRGHIAEVASLVDVLSVSVYPYAFFDPNPSGDPAVLPAGWLSQIEGMANGKPVAIAETAWIAEDLVLPEFGLAVPSTAEFQAAYTQALLREAADLRAEFVVWFAVVDLDALVAALPPDLASVARVWQDTGMYDQTPAPRPALEVWDNWRAATYAPVPQSPPTSLWLVH